MRGASMLAIPNAMDGPSYSRPAVVWHFHSVGPDKRMPPRADRLRFADCGSDGGAGICVGVEAGGVFGVLGRAAYAKVRREFWHRSALKPAAEAQPARTRLEPRVPGQCCWRRGGTHLHRRLRRVRWAAGLPDALRASRGGQEVRLQRGLPVRVRNSLRPGFPAKHRGRVCQLPDLPALPRRFLRRRMRHIQPMTTPRLSRSRGSRELHSWGGKTNDGKETPSRASILWICCPSYAALALRHVMCSF